MLLSLKELSRKTGLKTNFIRTCTSVLEGILQPHVKRDTKGRLFFGPRAVVIFERIGKLKKKGRSVPEIKRRIEKEFRDKQAGIPKETLSSRTRRHAVLAVLMVVIATIALFRQVTNYDFVNFDDDRYVTENLRVQEGLDAGNLLWAFTTLDERTGNWHPLTSISHMLDCHLFGLDPGRHHLISLLFHIANSALLLLVLGSMTGALWPSAFVAALFALHPLHVESVAWISERKDVLSTFFWILTMWAYAAYVRRPGCKRYVPVVILFSLGLMAKPMLVTLPFVLLLLDYWPLGRMRSGRPGTRADPVNDRPVPVLRLMGEKIPLLFLAMICIALTVLAQHKGQAVAPLELYPLGTRIANALTSCISYIGKMIWPQHLAVYYPRALQAPAWKTAAAALLLAGLTLFLVRAGRKLPYLAVGWLWYLGTLVPVIGIVQVGSQRMADRYTYIPLIGLFILIAWGVQDLFAQCRYRRTLLTGFTVIVITACMACTRLQVRHWENSISLFRHTAHVTERNPLAHHLLAHALMRNGDYNDALVHYREVLRLAPNYSKAPAVHDNMGSALMLRGDRKQAIVQFREALRLKPDSVETHFKLGLALMFQGELTGAIEHFTTTLSLDPDFQRATERLVAAHNSLALDRVRKGEIDAAIVQFQKLLTLMPENAEAHNNLGYALMQKNDFAGAIDHFREALRISPDLATAGQNLEHALAAGNTSE